MEIYLLFILIVLTVYLIKGRGKGRKKWLEGDETKDWYAFENDKSLLYLRMYGEKFQKNLKKKVDNYYSKSILYSISYS